MATLAEAQRLHVACYLEKVRELTKRYEAGDRAGSVTEFERDWEQLVAAHSTAKDELRDDEVCFALFGCAQVFLELRRSPAERLRWLEAAEAHVVWWGDPEVQAGFFQFRGNIAYESGDLGGAADWYSRALGEAIALGDRTLEAGMLQSLGNVYLSREDFTAAAEWFEKALDVCREAGDRRGEAVNLGSLGTVHADQGDHQSAVGFFEQAIAILEEFGDARQLETFVGNLGNSRSALDDHAGALRDLARALEIAEYLGDIRGVISRTGNLASAYGCAGRLTDALEHGRRALTLARQAELQPEVARSLARLGQVHDLRRDVASALECFVEAEALYTRLGMQVNAEHMRRNVAVLRSDADFQEHIREGNELAEAGDPGEALREYAAALALARARRSAAHEAVALGNLGYAHLLAGDLGEAEQCLEAALRISSGLSAPELQARHLSSLGNVAQQRGEYARAEDHYRRARELFRGVGSDTELGMVCANLAGIAAHGGRPDEAAVYLREALECLRAAGRLEEAARVEAGLRRWLQRGMDVETASRLGMDVLNARLGGEAVTADVTMLDGRHESGRVHVLALGEGFPALTLEPTNGRTRRIDFEQVESVRLVFQDGRCVDYGRSSV